MTTNKQRLPKPKPLIESFEGLPDPRIDRRRQHKLVDILTMGLCSIMTGGENFTDMEWYGKIKEDWLKTFLELPHGIPSHDTFNRVFSALDPYAFLDCFVCWVQGICPEVADQTVSIDGKALRHALNEGDSIPYIVSAWASEAGLVLGQVKVKDKSNEITAVPELLDALHLKGCIVTLDAMGCQKNIAAKIIDKGAHYVLALKGNHAIVHEEVEEFFADTVPPCALQCADSAAQEKMDFFQTFDAGHGRKETRRYWHSTDIDWFEDKHLWKNLRSIGMVESLRNVKGKTSIERRYYLCSLPLGAKRLGKTIREHWGVENQLHWSLDVVFREDDNRARTKNAAQNIASLRRIALNLIRKDTTMKASQKNKRIAAALDPEFLKYLLGI